MRAQKVTLCIFSSGQVRFWQEKFRRKEGNDAPQGHSVRVPKKLEKCKKTLKICPPSEKKKRKEKKRNVCGKAETRAPPNIGLEYGEAKTNTNKEAYTYIWNKCISCRLFRVAVGEKALTVMAVWVVIMGEWFA